MITYPVAEKLLLCITEKVKAYELLHLSECVAVIFPVITVIHPGQYNGLSL